MELVLPRLLVGNWTGQLLKAFRELYIAASETLCTAIWMQPLQQNSGLSSASCRLELRGSWLPRRGTPSSSLGQGSPFGTRTPAAVPFQRSRSNGGLAELSLPSSLTERDLGQSCLRCPRGLGGTRIVNYGSLWKATHALLLGCSCGG